jgi:predicted DNA-binding protein (UPF0278 family)
MKSFTEWREEIDQYLTTHKSFFQINQKMPTSVANQLEKYFTEKGCWVEIKKCHSCGGFDVSITK